MISASVDDVTDVVGIGIAIVMVALFAAVDMLPSGTVIRRLSGYTAGALFAILIALVAYRFAVLAG